MQQSGRGPLARTLAGTKELPPSEGTGARDFTINTMHSQSSMSEGEDQQRVPQSNGPLIRTTSGQEGSRVRGGRHSRPFENGR